MRRHPLSTSLVVALCLSAAGLQAQTNNPPATNLPPATPPLASTNGISLSNYTHPLTDVRRVNRVDDPKSSRDRHFDWWPRFGRHQQGTNDWLQYTLKMPVKVSESKVYWFDDAPNGGCRIPEEWRIVYQDGDQWKPVEASGPYPVTTNAYDVISFKPVTTSALRLEVKFRPNHSVGVEAWKVK